MKTETKHTPGPWFIRKVDCRHPSEGFQVEHEANGLRSVVADCRNYAVCEEHGTAEANAQLIASAPDLFTKLSALLKISETLASQRDEAYALIEQFGRTVTDMFEQMERGNWQDDLGHNVTLNTAMIALKKPVLDAIALRASLKP